MNLREMGKSCSPKSRNRWNEYSVSLCFEEGREVSGFKVRIGAAVLVCAGLATISSAAREPVVPVVIPTLPADSIPPVAETVSHGDDLLLATVANEAGPTVVPLPPGVLFGLMGLASAALARRHYLKRH